MYERMDRKTRHHRWLSRLFYRHNIGENVMKCKPEFSTTWYCKFMFAVGIAIILTAWCNSPADERTKPNPIYQVSK